METKRCPHCGNEKELSDFRKDKYTDDGYSYLCKECLSGIEKSRYHHLKDAGLCTQCGKELTIPGMAVCQTCHDKMNDHRKQWVLKTIELGLCTRCGINPAVPGRSYCLECANLRSTRNRNKKICAVEYLGGKCVACGFKTDRVEVYDFHHIEHGTIANDKKVAKMLMRPWNELKEELDKCSLLCANCHRILHAKDNEGKL